jgi:hypothetical protein
VARFAAAGLSRNLLGIAVRIWPSRSALIRNDYAHCPHFELEEGTNGHAVLWRRR